jgi:hypothetical protein
MPRLMSDQLNEKEKKVFAAFPSEKDEKGSFLYVGLSDLAGKAFNKRGVAPKTKGNSWVRNSLRKLLSLKLVQQKGARSGFYRLTGSEPPEPKTAEQLAEERAAAKNGTKKAAKKKLAKAVKAKGKGKAKGKVKGKGKGAGGDGDEVVPLSLVSGAASDSDTVSSDRSVGDGAVDDDDEDLFSTESR